MGTTVMCQPRTARSIRRRQTARGLNQRGRTTSTPFPRVRECPRTLARLAALPHEFAPHGALLKPDAPIVLTSFRLPLIARLAVFADDTAPPQRRWAGVLPRGSLIAGMALLAGCASPPQSAPPALKAPPAWVTPLPTAASDPGVAQADGAAALRAWWQRFDDPLLPQLIEQALVVSPDVAAAAARIERARATRAAAATAAGPQAGLGLTGSHGRSAPQQAVVGVASFGVQAAWEVDLFGGLAAARDAAQARLEASQASAHGARVALAAEVGTTYGGFRACEAQVMWLQHDADSREETARLAALTAQAGLMARAEAALAAAGAAQARTQTLEAAARCEQLHQVLVELTGQADATLRAALLSTRARLPEPAALGVPQAPAQALARRPDVFEAERAVVAAAGDVLDAQALERPQISLSGQIGPSVLRAGGETRSGPIWTLGPLQVVFPVLDGGSRAANRAAAQVAYEASVVQYQAQVRRAVREVESALVALESTAQRRQDIDRAVDGFEAVLQATSARQRAGVATLFELEDARRSLAAARAAVIDLDRQRLVAWIDLYRALGGGWQGPDADLAVGAPRAALFRP